MRLWHQHLLPRLSKQHILGQHRECCALRGAGWGMKHSTVDYAWKHGRETLAAYHNVVLCTGNLQYNIQFGKEWYLPEYCGKSIGKIGNFDLNKFFTIIDLLDDPGYTIYPEHTDDYLEECIANLKAKGFKI